MRPCMGLVSPSTLAIRSGRFDCFIAEIPRSDSARLIDLVKFRGMVPGSRRSFDIVSATRTPEYHNHWNAVMRDTYLLEAHIPRHRHLGQQHIMLRGTPPVLRQQSQPSEAWTMLPLLLSSTVRIALGLIDPPQSAHLSIGTNRNGQTLSMGKNYRPTAELNSA